MQETRTFGYEGTLGRAETIAYLRGLIAKLEEELVGVSADKPAARQLLAQMRVLYASIENTPNDMPPQKYVRYTRAVDAIEAYLRDAGKPVEREDIVSDLVKNGYRWGREDAASSLRKSIGHHVETEQGLRKNVLRLVDGKVALYDWLRPDERFK